MTDGVYEVNLQNFWKRQKKQAEFMLLTIC